MLKIKEVEKCGKYLRIYVKKPVFGDLRKFFHHLEVLFGDEDCFLNPMLDVTGKYVILTFILRNREDILPYVTGKVLLNDDKD
jgi:hypothetical protein